MEKQPLVSVITPTFNRKSFLIEAVNSVLAQTYSCWELIIVDDGSNDGTGEVVRDFVSDARIRYVYQENEGQSSARNRGIELSTGEYICFLDSDNRWLPDKLEQQIGVFADVQDVDVVYGKNISINEAGLEVGRKSIERFSGQVTEFLLSNNFISMNTTMSRRSVIIGAGCFNEKNRWDEDYELWLNVSLSNRFYFLDEWLGEYRIMRGQISDHKEQRLRANEMTIKNFLMEHPRVLTSTQAAVAISGFYRRWAYFLASDGRLADALVILFKALGSRPFAYANFRLLPSLILAKLRGTG